MHRMTLDFGRFRSTTRSAHLIFPIVCHVKRQNEEEEEEEEEN